MGFVLNSRFLPYDKKLAVLAKKLRSNMTEPERRLWFKYLNTASPRFHRQYPIDAFIFDFYCPKSHIVIEVDGESHDGNNSDLMRDKILETIYELKVLRFSNSEILNNLDEVTQIIDEYSSHFNDNEPNRQHIC